MTSDKAIETTPPTSKSAAAGQATTTSGVARTGRLPIGFGKFSGIYITAVFIAVFAAWIPSLFLTKTTLDSILNQQSITAILAIGLLFPLAAGAFDLSVGNMLGFSAMLCAWLTSVHHVDAGTTIVIALLTGALVGAINATVVVGFGVHSFIATLGMSSVLLAAIQRIGNGQFISGIPTSFTDLASPSPLGIPITAIYVAVLGVLGWYFLEHTPAGRRLYATGSGPESARLAGVRTKRLVFGALVTSSTVAALGGVILASEIGSASPDGGDAYLLPAFAAALLGSTQIKPGRVNVVGAVVALILLAVGVKGLQLAGAQDWVTDLFNGLALIIAVSAAAIARKGRVRGFKSWRAKRLATRAAGRASVS